MLEFKKNDAAAVLILTLTELVTIPGANFLLVFTHVLTKEVVAFVKRDIDDESNYSGRYNQFTINPSVLFTGKQPGEWHYKVYEQQSDSNTDPALSGSVVEYGKMILDRNTEFSFEKYHCETSFKTYNG